MAAMSLDREFMPLVVADKKPLQPGQPLAAAAVESVLHNAVLDLQNTSQFSPTSALVIAF